MIRTESEAFYTEDRPAVVGPEHVAEIARAVPGSTRQRMRLCLHPSIEDRFHDMVIVYTDKTEIRPHKHVGKDETLIVLEGEGRIDLFDDDIKIRGIEVAAYGGTKPFAVRIPADTFHTLVMHSARLVLYVATPGPFRRADTVWATW